jgi:CheY-like chemotaxis protein
VALILAADDDPVTREAFAAWLGSAGYDVRAAIHGGEVLLFLDEGLAPDLILLDVLMPAMDGNATLAALRHRHDPPPVLLVSAYLDGLGLDLGPPVVGGLPKPFTRAQLLEAVGAALGGRAT